MSEVRLKPFDKAGLGSGTIWYGLRNCMGVLTYFFVETMASCNLSFLNFCYCRMRAIYFLTFDAIDGHRPSFLEMYKMSSTTRLNNLEDVRRLLADI